MSASREQLGDLLGQLEQALRVAGRWGEQSPGKQQLASREPFSVDTLTFEEWLQWVFLPKMREILVCAASIPSALLAPMAEQSFDRSPESLEIIVVLHKIDQVVAGLQGAGRPEST